MFDEYLVCFGFIDGSGDFIPSTFHWGDARYRFSYDFSSVSRLFPVNSFECDYASLDSAWYKFRECIKSVTFGGERDE